MSNTTAPTPPGTFPPSVVINHAEDGISYQTNIIVCSVITWVSAAIFVGLRFYTRRVLVRVLGCEDWTILLALVFAGLCCAGMIEQAVYGLGRHVWMVDPAVLFHFGMSGWYTILWYNLSLWATKVSIILLYLRILTYPWAKAAAYGLMVITTLTNLWTFAAVFTACVPLASFWDHSIPGVCHSTIWWWGTTGMHMITDFLIYLLPAPVIWTLRLRTRQKLLLYFVFAFGFFLCIISIVRLVYLLTDAGHDDFSWDNVAIAYWTTVEIDFAIICACIMTLKPLLTRLFPTMIDERPPSSDVEQAQSPHPDGRPPTIGTRAVRRGKGGSAAIESAASGETIDEEIERQRPGYDAVTDENPGGEDEKAVVEREIRQMPSNIDSIDSSAMNRASHAGDAHETPS